MITINPEDSVKHFVELDIRSTEVFSRHGIDFCCGSHLSLKESCTKQNAPLHTVLQELAEALKEVKPVQINGSEMTVEQLVDYAESAHCKYLGENLEVIGAYLEKINNVHGAEHPELASILNLFDDYAEDLKNQLELEASLLFPKIRVLLSLQKENSQPRPENSENISKDITQLLYGHEQASECFEKIAQLSNEFTPPAAACTTYRLAFSRLSAFKQNLYSYIHLKSRYLFPKAIELEKQLLS